VIRFDCSLSSVDRVVSFFDHVLSLYKGMRATSFSNGEKFGSGTYYKSKYVTLIISVCYMLLV